MSALVGHDEAAREWQAALGSPRLHHAWILSGIKGLGKGEFARTAAAQLVAEAGVPQPGPAAHPDIIVLDHQPANETEEAKKAEGKPFQTKRNITIHQVRALRRRLETKPTLGQRRAIIIDPIDDLEPSAANALLKSLEEPPAGTFFLLVAHRLGRLLPTLRSRCQILRFASLSSEQIDAILRLEAPQANAGARAAAIAAAEGSPGAALDFVEQDLAKLHALMLRLVGEGDDTFTLRGTFAEELGAKPDRERQLAAIDLARAVVSADLGRNRARDIRAIAAHGELVRLAGQVPTYNFDAGLVAMEIAALLASLAMPREAA